MKRNIIFVLVLCALIVMPCFSGGQGAASGSAGVNSNLNPTGLPILKTRETFNIASSRSPLSLNNMVEKEAVKRSELDTNIVINWMEIPQSGWSERINILFASGDLPDCIIGPPQAILMQNLSMLADLTDLINPYSPALTGFLKERPDVKAFITAPDGRIYCFPGGVEAPWGKVDDSLFVNKTWLDAINMAPPSTTEEFYNMLKYFRDNDMNGNGDRNDEIPFTFCQAELQFSLKSMFGSFGVLDNAEHLQIINNVVTFTPLKTEYLNALRYFNRLYSEGLMDEEGFSQTNQQFTTKGRVSPMVVGSLVANLVGNIVTMDRIKDYVPVAPLKGPNGTQLWNRQRGVGLNINNFIISKKCRSPETLVRWYDYTNSTFEIMMLWMLGPENMAWSYDSIGRWRNIMDNVPQGSSWDEYRFTLAAVNGPQCSQIFDYNRPDIRSLDGDENTLNKLASQALQEPFFPAAVLPLGLEDPAIIRERAILYADIDSYVKSFVATSIMNGITDAQWNEHLRNCERLNIPGYVKPYQDLYDRSRR